MSAVQISSMPAHSLKADQPLALSVVIPLLKQPQAVAALLAALQSALSPLNAPYEVILVSASPITLADHPNVRVIASAQDGYGSALKAGIAASTGAYILTLDADSIPSAQTLANLWSHRTDSDLVVASRYIGNSQGGTLRSGVLNAFFRRGLDLKVRDISSRIRLYKARMLKSLPLENDDYAVLLETLVKAYCEGWTIREIPLEPAQASRQATPLTQGPSFFRTFWKLYRLRNSIMSADYDFRAHDSAVPPQRYWQRQRFRHISELVQGEGATLDVGCGSSHIIGILAKDSVAVDILRRKLRFNRRFETPCVEASGFDLPFPNESFPCVLCSQVIEHVPKDSPILGELMRTLKPGGALVLGTPDYANWEWVVTEAIYDRVLPSAYADEHISHYTKDELVKLFEGHGYALEDTRYILRGELILKFRKPV